MKIYLSGQISNLSKEEYTDNFGLAEALMLKLNHEPVNPIKVLACEGEDCFDNWTDRKQDGSYLHAYHCYMKHDILAMLECEGIAMLPNWRASSGATFELMVADKCGLRAFYIDKDYRRLV